MTHEHVFEGTHPFRCVKCGRDADQFEMRFGARIYTAAQMEQIVDATRNRKPLNVPAIPLDQP